VCSLTIKFTVLGAVRAWRGDTELRLGPPQQRAVLALLLAAGGQPVSLSELVDLLWAADPPASAANIVHRYIGTLRRVLEPGLPSRAAGRWLIPHAGGYRLAADEDHLDLLRLRRLAGQAAAAELPGQAVALYLEALGLCPGRCAGDLAALRGHPAFTAVDRECLALAGQAAEVALRAGLAPQALPAVRQAAGQDALAEPLQARLMLLLAAAGHQAEALAVYEATRGALADELGIDPGAELRDAHHRVLNQQVNGHHVNGHQVNGQHVNGHAERAAARVIRPAQLPADLATFAGRRAEVARVSALLAEPAGGAMLIGAIDGMPGAGKTTLAVHWAHLVANRFPDGQLYVDLRGFDLGGTLGPAEALNRFLPALGATPPQVPADLDGRAALFRSLLAGRRVLVVLDNARDVAQVRPLLPGSPGCMVIVTSRSRLTGLVASDGASLLTLDVFSPADAHEALARRVGAGRAAAEPAAVEEIIAASGRLPLALALVAARAAAHPQFPLAAIAGELRDAQGSLDAFAGEGGPGGSPDVRAVFSWSYRMLSPPAARLFRLLSLQAGPDISLAAAASLTALPARPVRALLAELTRTRLLTESSPGRYSLHDLLRSYAAELCAETDPAGDRDTAISRLLGHYLHSAGHSHLLLQPHQRLPGLEPPADGTGPERPGDYAGALAWFTAEHRVLEAAVSYAARHGLVRYAWRLAYVMTPFYQRSGLWHDWAVTARTALEAAQADDDLTGQACLHRILAGACFHLGGSGAALAELECARDLLTRLGLPAEQAYLHSDFGTVLSRLGRHEEAMTHHRRALELYRAAGLRIGEAYAMAGTGSCANRLGRPGQAISSIAAAMDIHTELGDSYGAASAWETLGESYHLLGEHGAAAACLERAMALHRALGSRADEAGSWAALGDIQLGAGEPAAARASFQRALAIFGELRLPQADEVRGRLAALTQPGRSRPATHISWP
jgi:DNA-binding SARP family transcriptional activator/tetratricopeptide (TPR) repeat protein